MTLTFFPSWMPERSMGWYVPLWCLIAGGKRLADSGSGEIPLIGDFPFRVFELNKSAEARWRVQDQYLLDFVQFFNGEHYQDTASGAFVMDEAPQLKGATNVNYHVLELTNFNGIRIPVRFTYESYFAKTKSDRPKLLWTLEGVVSSIDNCSLPKRDFRDLSGVRVNDERLARAGQRLGNYSYFVTNGSVQPIEDVSDTIVRSLELQAESQKRQDINHIPSLRLSGLQALSVILAALAAFFVWQFFRWKRGDSPEEP